MRQIVRYVFYALIPILSWSCAERTICPAYQSAFIHDEETLRKQFSYFKEDSTPKILTASKNKYLIAEKQSYRKKRESLNTIKMQTIYPVLDDSTELAGDVMLMAEVDVVDTVALDSITAQEIGWEEHFNVEQEFYLHYFNDILVYPEERALQEAADKLQDDINKDMEERTGEKLNIFQKFLRLFKKKDKSNNESTEEGIEGSDGEVETTATDISNSDSPPKKKKKFGLGKLFGGEKKKKKNKNKQSEQEPPEKENQPDPENDEDDDF